MNIKKMSPFFPRHFPASRDLYVASKVGEALKLGSYPIDWCFDYEHGRLVEFAGAMWEPSGGEGRHGCVKVPSNLIMAQ